MLHAMQVQINLRKYLDRYANRKLTHFLIKNLHADNISKLIQEKLQNHSKIQHFFLFVSVVFFSILVMY